MLLTVKTESPKYIFWDVKIIRKQSLHCPENNLQVEVIQNICQHAQVCLLRKFASIAKMLKEDSKTPSPEHTAGSCYCWFESTIRKRGFSRRNIKSRLTFDREKEEKVQDFRNNNVWTDYFKSKLSEHQTKYSIPEKIFIPTLNHGGGKNAKLDLATWSWPKNLPVSPPRTG